MALTDLPDYDYGINFRESFYQFYTSKFVYRSWRVLLHMWKKLCKAFVAPEEAACNLINDLK